MHSFSTLLVSVFDPCSRDMCKNIKGSKCVNVDDSYTCECREGSYRDGDKCRKGKYYDETVW